MRSFAKTKPIVQHIIPVLFILPSFPFYLCTINKSTPVATELEISLSFFVAIQLCASIRPHELCCGTAANSNCNHSLTHSVMSPTTNRTKRPLMRQRSARFFSPVWQTVVPIHRYWFQMSVDALSLHWSQELVVSGLRKTDYVCLAVILVAAGRLMQEVFPTEREGFASLADHLC